MKVGKKLIVEIVIPLLAVVVPLATAIYLNNIQSKNIEAYLLDTQYLKNPNFPKDLPVEFSCQDQMVYLKVRFINHGNDIEEKDINGPITVELQNINKVLHVEVAESDPVELNFETKNEAKKVVIGKGLINHNDSFCIKIYCTISSVAKKGYIKNICCRIVGLHKINYYPYSPGLVNKPFILKSLVITIVLLFAYNIIWRLMDRTNYNHKVITRRAMYLGMLILLTSIFVHLIVLFNLN